MDQTGQKKLFRAELQRLQTKGTAPTSAATDLPHRDILAAIDLLRQDIRGIESLIRPAADAEVPSSPEPMAEVSDHRAEVTLVRTEMRALSLAIQQTKSEIAALRPHNSEDDRLVAVTEELDAIVTSTEKATDTILEAAETIDSLAAQLQGQSEAGNSFTSRVTEDMRDAVVRIFEACNFQDITGQRVTKVVKTLQFVEQRVNKMIEIWGRENFEDLPAPPEIHSDEESKLLNGPALENRGVTQADIDALFD